MKQQKPTHYSDYTARNQRSESHIWSVEITVSDVGSLVGVSFFLLCVSCGVVGVIDTCCYRCCAAVGLNFLIFIMGHKQTVPVTMWFMQQWQVWWLAGLLIPGAIKNGLRRF